MIFWDSSRWYIVAANDGLNERFQLTCVPRTAVHITTAFNTVNLQISFTIRKNKVEVYRTCSAYEGIEKMVTKFL